MKPNLKLAPAPENFKRDSDSALLSTQAELIKLMSKLSKFDRFFTLFWWLKLNSPWL